MMRARCLFLICCLSFVEKTFGQQAATQWQALADPGNTGSRFEDIYFLDSLRGFAVAFYDPGFYKTIDGGATWQAKPFSLNARLRAVEFLDDGLTGFAGSVGQGLGPYLTTDAGETWANISSRLPEQQGNLYDNRICGVTHRGDTIIAVGWWGGYRGKVFVSRNRGVTWGLQTLPTSLATNLVDATTTPDGTVFLGGGISTSATNIFGANGSNVAVILRSKDGGRSWTKVFADTAIGGRIWKLQFLNDRIGYGSFEPMQRDTVAMVKTIDGGATWTIIGARESEDSTYNGWQTQGIGFINESEGWMGGYYGGLFHTTDSGKSWTHEAFGSNFNRFFRVDSTLMYAGGKTIYRWSGTTDGTPHALHDTAGLPHLLYPISPNPTTGKLSIAFDLRNETNVVLQIVSTDGRHSQQILAATMSAGHHDIPCDVSALPPGPYIVWLGTDEIPIVQRFVLRP